MKLFMEETTSWSLYMEIPRTRDIQEKPEGTGAQPMLPQHTMKLLRGQWFGSYTSLITPDGIQHGIGATTLYTGTPGHPATGTSTTVITAIFTPYTTVITATGTHRAGQVTTTIITTV